MGLLVNKKILLAVSGSIASYKSVVLCRSLIKEGATVKVIMTPAATEFISALTFSTLTGHEVLTSVTGSNGWNNHVELGLWADVMLVAPCTATTLAKMAHGVADSIIVACYLSAKCHIMVAPAMDLDMWAHPTTKSNLSLLKSYGNSIISVGNGYLASGLTGDGRMAEPEEIVNEVYKQFHKNRDLEGTKVLITAGPTYEAIDPVRFIGNRSSGKQGIALANECANRGADVVLILGPSTQTVASDHIKVLRVESAKDMYETANQYFATSDLIIFAAAVADYKSKDISSQKIKKEDREMSIILEKTIDIAATFGRMKQPNQCLVGFALETNNEIDHAKGKLHKKNLDFIVLNSLRDEGAGFAHDTNKVTILLNNEKILNYDVKSKSEVAEDIINVFANFYLKKGLIKT